MEQDTFRDYGYSFQVKVVASLLTDRIFLSRIMDIMKLDYYDNESFKWITRKIIEFYSEFKEFPTLEVFKSEMMKDLKDNVLLKTEVVTSLREIWKNLESPDLGYIKEEAINFCRNQELKNAILDSVEHLKNRNFESIKERIDSAYKRGIEYHAGMDLAADVDIRYSEDSKMDHISTGWDVIDEITGGGMPKKKLGIIIAPLGAGKTWIAVHLGASAAEQGFIVVHYTLEISEKEIGKRYDARLSGIAMDKLELHKTTVKQRLQKVPGKIYIKEYLQGVTLNGIESHIDQLIMSGIVPDMVIIDYDELIDVPPDQTARYDQQMQMLYRNAKRKIAVGKNVALWIPAQSTREGAEEDVVRTTHSANSYGKNREADFVLTLSRKDRDKVANTARFSVQKSRLGPDGLTFPADFNTATAMIKLYRENTTTGRSTQERMGTDEAFTRDVLRRNYGGEISNRTEPADDDYNF